MTDSIKYWDEDLSDVLENDTRDKYGYAYRYTRDPFQTKDGCYAIRVAAIWGCTKEQQEVAMRVAWEAIQRYAQRRSDVVVWAEDATTTVCVKCITGLATQVSLDDIPVATQVSLDQ